MKGLNSEDLNRPFEHGEIVGDDYFVKGQVVFNLPFIVSVQDNPTSAGVETGQNIAFGQMNYKLNQLLVDLLYRACVTLLEKVLKCVWHVIVINFNGSSLVVLQIAKIYYVLVVNVF